MDFFKQSLAAVKSAIGVKDRLMASWYKRSFDGTVCVSGMPNRTFNVNTFTIPVEAEAPSMTLEYKEYINVPEHGIYTFYLTSDVASVLKITRSEIINNDGMHSPTERNGHVALAIGLHNFALDFIEGGGGYTLKLQYSYNGAITRDIPGSWLKHLVC